MPPCFNFKKYSQNQEKEVNKRLNDAVIKNDIGAIRSIFAENDFKELNLTSPIYDGIRTKSNQSVMYLLDFEKEKRNNVDFEKYISLLLGTCVYYDNYELFYFIFSKIENKEKALNLEGYENPLNFELKKDNPNIKFIRFLIDNGSNLSVITKVNELKLKELSQNNFYANKSFNFRKQASEKYQVYMANYDLANSAKEGDIGGIRASLADGADNFNGALLNALDNDHDLAAKYLIDHGANINGEIPNSMIDTILAEFIHGGDYNKVKKALEWGAIPKMESFTLSSFRYDRDEIFQLLIDYGLKNNLNEDDVRTLKNLAENFEALKINKILNEYFPEEIEIRTRDLNANKSFNFKRYKTSSYDPEISPKDNLFNSAKEGDIGGIRAALADGVEKDDLNEALITASEEGHGLIVQYLLDSGADIHAEDDEALRLAVYSEHSDVVKLLLNAGADIHARNDEALCLAAINGHRDVVELLLNTGADVHARNNTALRLAASNGHSEVVKLLLNYGADIHALNDWALRWAAHNGHSDVVKLLLNSGANVHARDDVALQWAEENGHSDIVQLLQGWSNRNTTNDQEEGNNEIREAFNFRKQANKEYFKGGLADGKSDSEFDSEQLKKGIKVEMEHTNDSKKAKEIAKDHLVEDPKYYDHLEEMEKKYVKAFNFKRYKTSSYDPNLSPNQNLLNSSEEGDFGGIRAAIADGANDLGAALIKASKKGHGSIVKYLLDMGADVRNVNNLALRLAAHNGHLDVIELLLEHGADVHVLDDSVLRRAARDGDYEVVKVLLNAGADVNAGDGEALQSAAYYGHGDVVKLLLENGADVHANNDDALQWAAENGHSDVVQLLEEWSNEIKEAFNFRKKLKKGFSI